LKKVWNTWNAWNAWNTWNTWNTWNSKNAQARTLVGCGLPATLARILCQNGDTLNVESTALTYELMQKGRVPNKDRTSQHPETPQHHYLQ
jgi:hypothetical protein